MKTLTGQLTASLYDLNVHWVADLYSFNFGGSIGTLNITSGDQNIVSGSTTFSASHIGISRGSMRVTAELETDTLDITIAPGSATLGGVSYFVAATRGTFDLVPVTLSRAYFSGAYGSFTGTSNVFTGYIQDVRPGSTQIELTAKSMLSVLTKPFPGRVISTQCPYQLYSTECGVSSASFTLSTTVQGGASTTSVVNVAATMTANQYAYGVLTVNNEKRTVISNTTSAFTVYPPLSVAPSASAAVTAVRSCAKTAGVCNGTFSNVARFGGFPTKPRER